jgi:predicted RNase H-like HicB family nuclease
MMMERFTIIVEQGQDGYLISQVVELPGCHTQARTHDELMKRTREAIELYLSANGEQMRNKFVGLQHIDV